jgi:TonB family protein
LLIPLLVLAGCSRNAEPEPVAEPAGDETVSAEEVSPEVGDGVETTTELTDLSGSGVADSQVTPLNVDEGREILVQSPQPLVTIQPFYPFSKRMEGIEGQVMLQFTIDRLGRVVNPTVGASTVPEFNEYALEAARDLRFLPALADDKPIDLEVSFPMTYVSEKGSLGVLPGSIFSRLDLIFDTYYLDGPDGYEKADVPVTPIYRQVPVAPRGDDGNPIAGRVLISFTVSTEGRVTDPKVLESTATELEMPALTAIRYWMFIPRIVDGQPMETRVKQPITFNFSDPVQEEGG